MYSLTFCVRVVLPERHPSMASHRPAARTPRRAFALCRHIVGWTQACN